MDDLKLSHVQTILVILWLIEVFMFINRYTELAFLNTMLERQRPSTGQFAMVYGRRRVGKTALLRHWAEQSQQSFTYWVADKEPATLQRKRFFTAFLEGLNMDIPVPLFESWSELWRSVATLLHGRKHIIILDELPYAAESDSAMLSALQHAWDQLFQQSQTMIVICGSHVRTMELLLGRQSPIFGRLTGQWHMQPLSFGTLRLFLPTWTAEQQVAAYAIVGGIPTYLSWLDAKQTLSNNIRNEILRPGSLALSEAAFLLQDEVREPRPYLAVLQAIGRGHHTLKEIANDSLVTTAHLSFYLAQLQELRLIERRLPATMPPATQRTSRLGRYHLSDPFLRFYFRFLAAAAAAGGLSYRPERVLPQIESGLRAFIGSTAWEELARQWVDHPNVVAMLGFVPQTVGSHWSRQVQADIIAINWQTHDLLIGECKWLPDAIDRSTVRDFLERTVPRVLADMKIDTSKWTIRTAFFARSGITPAAAQTLQTHRCHFISLEQLYQDLAEDVRA
jgi:uncharacterized protein